jgi:transposase
LPDLVVPSARRTLRLWAEQRQLALDQGGLPGVRTAARQGMPISARTLLRFVRQPPLATPPPPRILGVDDFAFRKGQTYGTILVDLQQHAVIDLLPDRSATTLARWLKQHPGVEIISRDRANEYAEGARCGAPTAIQVADRFHLLKTMRDVLQRLLSRRPARLQEAALAAPPTDTMAADVPAPPPPAAPQPSDTPPAGRPIPVAPDQAAAMTGGAPPADRSSLEPDRAARPALAPPTSLCGAPQPAPITEQGPLASRERRLARYHAVCALHAQGLSQQEIARQLHLNQQTVRRFVRADQFPERAQRCTAWRGLAPCIPYLRDQLAAGRDNALQLWREIRDQQGYQGSQRTVARWVAQQRQLGDAPRFGAPPSKRGGRPPKSLERPPPAPDRALSARQAAWLLVKRPSDLEEAERTTVERLCAGSAEIQLAYPLAQEFMRIVRDHHVDALDSWFARADASGLPELQSFVAGLRRDRAAVLAALTLPFSNGQVEGQVNRLKTLKRQMYGRAGFELLRRRVLAA